MSRLWSALGRARPGERAFLGLTLALVLGAFLGLGRWSGPDDLLTYGGLWAGYWAVLILAGIWGDKAAPRALRIGITTLTATIFYGAMADIAFRWTSWNLDSILARLDSVLFSLLGFESPWTGTYSRAWLEAAAWVYIFFLVYFYAAMIFGFIFRPREESEILYSNLVLLYALAYLGYFFLPARGPIEALGPPEGGGFFHGWVLALVQTGGGPHGAMPSVHAAAPAYFCIHDLARGRWTGRLSALMVCAIGASTLILRYHYLSDFLAGVLLAYACHRYGTPICLRWLRREPRTEPAVVS